jgi:hypothetical protein
MQAKALLLAILLLPMAVKAQDVNEELPDEELLEFIASWEGDEKDWLDNVQLSLWLGKKALDGNEKTSAE